MAVTGDGAELGFTLGRGGSANVTERHFVTLLFPATEPGKMSLIVDGRGELEGRVTSDGPQPPVRFIAESAVRHRPAPKRDH